ncbi:LOW QUALITY PROTEIN: hypothetical protein AAY473_004876 [Plecturocebus cupreus]
MKRSYLIFRVRVAQLRRWGSRNTQGSEASSTLRAAVRGEDRIPRAQSELEPCTRHCPGRKLVQRGYSQRCRAGRRGQEKGPSLHPFTLQSLQVFPGCQSLRQQEINLKLAQYQCKNKSNNPRGQVQWLPPVIPALWEAEVGRSLEEFRISLANMVKPHLYQKIKKLAKRDGACLSSQPLRRLRQENHLNPRVLWTENCGALPESSSQHSSHSASSGIQLPRFESSSHTGKLHNTGQFI